MKKKINGIKVFLHGEADAQPVIFIHGFPFDHTIWDDVVEQLKDEYYCISYDIRGFGESDIGCGQTTMESYVDDLDAIIKELDLKDVVVCGFSMGGYIALRANERLQNFKALILANTTTTGDSDEAKLKRANVIKSIDEEGVESFLNSFFKVAFTASYQEVHKDKILFLKEKILNFNPIGIKGGLLAMISRTDTTISLEQSPSTLFIEASNDEIIPPKTKEELSKKIKKIQYIQINESGHLSMLHKPKEFLVALKSFLSNKYV